MSTEPDKYMSQTELHNLYDGVRAAEKDGRLSTSFVLDSIHIMRLAYQAGILKADEEQNLQSEKHAAELAALKLEIKIMRELVLGIFATSGPPTSTPGTVEARAEQPTLPNTDPAHLPHDAPYSWPAKRFALHIGTSIADYRRDLPSWGGMTRDGFTERLEFDVFQFEEPGLIKIYVIEGTSSPRRVMAGRDPGIPDGWKKRLEFYAYGSPRPGTYRVWIAYRADPDRCLFMKGDGAEAWEGWECRLEFWVPK